MTHKQHLRAAHKRNIRWRILALADAGRVYGVSETTVLRALTDANLGPTPTEIREEATYLARKGLIDILEDHSEWAFRVTAEGTDIVNYDASAPRSIGRPEKYY